jgi:hypothetical protein
MLSTGFTVFSFATLICQNKDASFYENFTLFISFGLENLLPGIFVEVLCATERWDGDKEGLKDARNSR